MVAPGATCIIDGVEYPTVLDYIVLKSADKHGYLLHQFLHKEFDYGNRLDGKVTESAIKHPGVVDVLLNMRAKYAQQRKGGCLSE